LSGAISLRQAVSSTSPIAVSRLYRAGTVNDILGSGPQLGPDSMRAQCRQRMYGWYERFVLTVQTLGSR
jgi:hypothetical protein